MGTLIDPNFALSWLPNYFFTRGSQTVDLLTWTLEEVSGAHFTPNFWYHVFQQNEFWVDGWTECFPSHAKSARRLHVQSSHWSFGSMELQRYSIWPFLVLPYASVPVHVYTHYRDTAWDPSTPATTQSDDLSHSESVCHASQIASAVCHSLQQWPLPERQSSLVHTVGKHQHHTLSSHLCSALYHTVAIHLGHNTHSPLS